MAASVEGVFRIIDRASGPMRKMMAQAKMTDAAVNKLGRDLDRLGNRGQLQNIANVERSLRGVRTEGDKLSTTLGSVDKSGSNVTKSMRGTNRESHALSRNMKSNVAEGNRFVNTLIRMGTALWSVQNIMKEIRLPLMAAAIGGAIRVVMQLGGALTTMIPQLTSVAALAAPLPALFTGMGLAMISVKLATNDLSKAMGGNKKALQGLTPEARSFVLTLKQYKPVIKEIRQEAQRGLFPGLEQSLRRAQRGVPLARTLVRRSGQAVGQGVNRQVERLTTNQSLADLGLVGGQGIQMIERAIEAIGNLMRAVIHFTVAARPFSDWLSKTILGWTKWAEKTAEAGRESRRISDWLNRSRADLITFGHIIRDLWFTLVNIGKVARPAGTSLWQEVERAVRMWREVTGSMGGQLKMARFFAGSIGTLRETMGLITDLVQVLFRMGNEPGTAGFISRLREMVPTLEEVINTFVSVFLPVTLDILVQVMKILTLISQATGPINILLQMISRLLGMFNRLVNASETTRTVFISLFSVVALGLFVRKLQAATSGMWGFAAASRAAAGAEMAGGVGATAGGAAGGARRAGLFASILGRGEGGRAAQAGGRALIRRSMATAGSVLAIGGARGLARYGTGALARGAGTVARGAGKLAWPVMAAMGVYDAATARTEGNAGWQALMRGSAALSGATFGLVKPMQTGGQIQDANVRAIMEGGQLTDTARSWGRLGFHRALYDRDRGATVQGIQPRLAALGGDDPTMRQARQQLAVLRSGVRQLKATNTDAANAAASGLENEIRLRQRLIDQVDKENARKRQGAGLMKAKRLGGQYGAAFNMIAAREGVHAASEQTVTRALADMATLPEAGAAYIARGTLRWAREAAKQNPALLDQYDRLRKGVLARFQRIYEGARVWNDKIITGTKSQWKQIADAMTGPIEQVREKNRRQFTLIQQEAVQVLQAMGFTGTQSARLVQAMETGGQAAGAAKADVRAVQAGVTQGAMNSPHARGGRISGRGLSDTVPIAPGHMAAPGELIVNRHTEARINAMLGGRTTLGREVTGESRPHAHQRGGRVTGDTDVNPAMLAALRAMGAAAGSAINITSGFRSVKEQAGLFSQAVAKYGSVAAARKWVAPPGRSKHGTGFAADISPGVGTFGGMAARFGLGFPYAWEPWHIEMSGRGKAGGARGAAAPGAGSAMGQVPPLGFTALNAPGVAGALSYQVGKVYATGARLRLNQLLGAQGAAAGAPAVPGGGGATGNMALAHRMLLGQGFGQGEWPALRTLWMGESGFDNMARNPSSGAFGIPQALPPGKMGAAAAGGNAGAQIAWGLNYIKGRYGTPTSALSAWQGRSPHWYGKGGRMASFAGWHAGGGEFSVNRPTLFGAGEAGRETVKISRAGGGGSAEVSIGQVVIHNNRPGDIRQQMRDEMAQAWNDFSTMVSVAGGEG